MKMHIITWHLDESKITSRLQSMGQTLRCAMSQFELMHTEQSSDYTLNDGEIKKGILKVNPKVEFV